MNPKIKVTTEMEPAQATSRRPEDSAFKQQRLPAWQPILTPLRVIAIFVVIGIVFIPIGGVLLASSNEIVQYVKRYDGDNVDVEGCELGDNANVTCQITFDVDQKMTGPVWVYYELTNFYQNHRRYVKSRSATQLMGEQLSSGELTDCDPLKKNGDQLLNPCGLIANSMFNDEFTLATTEFDLDESGISWKSDREDKFAQVSGFKKRAADVGDSCADVFGSNSKYDDCGFAYDDNGDYYAYWYPNNDKTQYLYETYDGVISPLDGVEDEHFIVWMRTAGLPEFRKPYGRIKDDIPKGTQLTFNVTARFLVDEFDGSKSLVITEIGEYGGKNPFLGIAYIVVGVISMALAAVFGVKHLLFPRPLGDTRYLGWGDH